MTTAQAHAAAGFVHEAMLYAGTDEFLAGALSFVEGGVEAGEAVLVVVDRDKIDALRTELEGASESVLFADMADVGSNPARIIPAWREFVDAHGGGGNAVRGIGEPIWAGREPAELVECQRHESLLNLAFADAPAFRLLCPYDTDTLAEDVLEEALRSHPSVVHRGADYASSTYRGIDAIAAPFAEPLPEPRVATQELWFDGASLGSARRLVRARAAASGLDGHRAHDLVLAVNEVATNSVRHGGGSGLLRVWDEGGRLVCEVRDVGRIERPLLGRERPTAAQEGGRGHWLANQACDLVQVRTFEDGSVVRLHMRLR